jgi:hypothetical protein
LRSFSGHACIVGKPRKILNKQVKIFELQWRSSSKAVEIEFIFTHIGISRVSVLTDL